MLVFAPPHPGDGALPPATSFGMLQPSQMSRGRLRCLRQQRLESSQSAGPALPQGDGAFY